MKIAKVLFVFLFAVLISGFAAPDARAEYALGISPPSVDIKIPQGESVQSSFLILRSEPDKEESFTLTVGEDGYLILPIGVELTLPLGVEQYRYDYSIDTAGLELGSYKNTFEILQEKARAVGEGVVLRFGVEGVLNFEVVSNEDFLAFLQSERVAIEGIDLDTHSGMFNKSATGTFALRNYSLNPIPSLEYKVELYDSNGDFVKTIVSDSTDLLCLELDQVDFTVDGLEEGEYRADYILSYEGTELFSASESFTVLPYVWTVDATIIVLSVAVALVMVVMMYLIIKKRR
ncbi:MAG: hypothetical protein ABIA47_05105 [bacterium]